MQAGKENIDIGTKEGLDKLARNITFEDDYGENPYEKIEIYWPTDILEVGIVYSEYQTPILYRRSAQFQKIILESYFMTYYKIISGC